MVQVWWHTTWEAAWPIGRNCLREKVKKKKTLSSWEQQHGTLKK